jgi:2-dehydro-3-deoxygluconokinase
MKIACLGEVMLELVPTTGDQALLGVAGDTFNTAVYLRRGLDPASHEVAYVTALGDDAGSARIMAALEGHGLATDFIEIRQGGTPGLYMITTDEAGERSFDYWRSAAAARSLFQPPCKINPAALDGVDILLLTGISIAILPQATRDLLVDWIDGFRAKGGQLAFDSNYRPRLWEDAATARRETMRLWARADIALPSLDDEMALFEERDEAQVLARLQGAGVTFGAIKRGADGPRALSPDGAVLDVAPVSGIVDTTAAGDSFNAGYLAGVVLGEPAPACMARGHALASRVIQHRGAIIAEAR